MQDPLDGPVDVAKDHRSRTAADQNLCTPRIDELGKGPITNIDELEVGWNSRFDDSMPTSPTGAEVLKGRAELVR